MGLDEMSALARHLRIAARGRDERTPFVVLVAVTFVVATVAGLVSLAALLVYLL
jgi:hypothetical protein